MKLPTMSSHDSLPSLALRSCRRVYPGGEAGSDGGIDEGSGGCVVLWATRRALPCRDERPPNERARPTDRTADTPAATPAVSLERAESVTCRSASLPASAYAHEGRLGDDDVWTRSPERGWVLIARATRTKPRGGSRPSSGGQAALARTAVSASASSTASVSDSESVSRGAPSDAENSPPPGGRASTGSAWAAESGASPFIGGADGRPVRSRVMRVRPRARRRRIHRRT